MIANMSRAQAVKRDIDLHALWTASNMDDCLLLSTERGGDMSWLLSKASLLWSSCWILPHSTNGIPGSAPAREPASHYVPISSIYRPVVLGVLFSVGCQPPSTDCDSTTAFSGQYPLRHRLGRGSLFTHAVRIEDVQERSQVHDYSASREYSSRVRGSESRTPWPLSWNTAQCSSLCAELESDIHVQPRR